MKHQNEAMTRWTAQVAGRYTGLAGCIKRCEGCLRADDILLKESSQFLYRRESPHNCGSYVLITSVPVVS